MSFEEEESRESWPSRVKFRQSTPADESAMLDFVNLHFVPLEPLNAAVDLCPPGYRMSWFDELVLGYIREGMSLLAADAENGDILGVVIYTKCTSEGG